MTRMRYCRNIHRYQKQIEYRDISTQYVNIGTLFEEKEFEDARQELLSWLIETRIVLETNYLLLEDIDVSALSTIQKRRRDNVFRLCERMKTLQHKLQKKLHLERDDYRQCFYGLWEILTFGIVVYADKDVRTSV